MMKKLLAISLITAGFSLFSNAQTYYTRQAGTWGDNTALWSTAGPTGAPCACTPGNIISGAKIVTVGNTVTSTDALSSVTDAASLVINAGDTATIRISSFDVSHAATIVVNGTLIIFGDLNMSGATSLTVGSTGHVVIFGNVNNTGSASVTNNGSFLVRGKVIAGGSAFGGTKQSFETGVVTGTMNVIQ